MDKLGKVCFSVVIAEIHSDGGGDANRPGKARPAATRQRPVWQLPAAPRESDRRDKSRSPKDADGDGVRTANSRRDIQPTEKAGHMKDIVKRLHDVNLDGSGSARVDMICVEAAEEIEGLRKAVLKYADAARMGNVEPSDLQQVIDRAFQFQPAE